jgi:LPS-assembly protein
LYQGFESQNDLPLFDSSELTFGYRALFRDNRFSGIDRIGDANQLTVGVTTRFLDAATGQEYLRASVGQIRYFRDRRVTLSGAPPEEASLSSSALAGVLAARLGSRWSVSGTLVWDPQDEEVDEGTFALQYKEGARRIVNLGFRRRLDDSEDLNQSDISLYWPVSKRFAILARWNYDLETERTIEGFGGLEYNDCCWRVRLLARRFLDSPSGRDFDELDSDEGIFLQLVFKGLAGVGNTMESVLQRSIKGYTPEI